MPSVFVSAKKRVSFLRSPNYTRTKLYVETLLEENLWSERPFTKHCTSWFKAKYGAQAAYLTSSCAQALYLGVSLMEIQPEDEVILPSYTHPSTANAFASAGAQLVFVDVEPRQCTLALKAVEEAITPRTKAVVAVHYGGCAADMHHLKRLSEAHKFFLIEDVAQGFLATQNGRLLGSFGHISCFSFENQKNISCGEGGALLLNSRSLCARAELAYEAGTNKIAYLQKRVDAYEWCRLGGKYAPSELVAAHLWAGLQEAPALLEKRRRLWRLYHTGFQDLALSDQIAFSDPLDNGHNAHLYYLMLATKQQCAALYAYLNNCEIEARTHYIPLHSSSYGRRYRFCGPDTYTTAVSERLLRLPLHEALTADDVQRVIKEVATFLRQY